MPGHELPDATQSFDGVLFVGLLRDDPVATGGKGAFCRRLGKTPC